MKRVGSLLGRRMFDPDDPIFGDFFSGASSVTSPQGSFSWKLVHETESLLTLELLVPGMKPDQVILRRTEFELRADWIDRNGVAREERIGLSRIADMESAAAHMEAGILTVVVRKNTVKEAKPILIPIKSS